MKERTGRCWWRRWWRRVATEWMGRARERQDCIPWKWGWSPWQLQLRVTWCGGVKEREMDKRVQKKSRQRAGLLALPADDKGGEGGNTDGGGMDCRRCEGKRGSGTSVAIWFICSPPDYSDVMCVLSEKRNNKGYSERGDEEGWGRWRGKSSPKIEEKQEWIIIKDLFRLKSNTSTRVQVEWLILLFVYENLLFCFFVHFTFVRFWNCGADWEIIFSPSSWCEHVCTAWFVI